MDLTTAARTNFGNVAGEERASDDVTSLSVSELEIRDHLRGLYIAIGIFFALFGTLENSVVIYLFTRKNSSYAGNAYVIALAVLDILACIVIIQIILFLDELQSMQYVFMACWVFTEWLVLSYLCVLAAMSLDRLTAVARPLKYQRIKILQKYIVGGIMTVVTCLVILQALFISLNAEAAVKKINNTLFLLTIAGCLVVIIVSYTIIIWKLMRQNVHGQSESSKNNTIASIRQSKKVIGTKGSVHVTTVKVFVGVSILFVASYIPVVIAHLTAHHIIFKLLYMMNHVGNPIIYYALNKRFRKDAIKMVRKVVH